MSMSSANPIIDDTETLVYTSMTDDDEDQPFPMNRGSVGSGRLSGCRLSTTEFENAPRKSVHEIDPVLAAKWLNP